MVAPRQQRPLAFIDRLRMWAQQDEERAQMQDAEIRRQFRDTLDKDPGALTTEQCRRILQHRAQAIRRQAMVKEYETVFGRRPVNLTPEQVRRVLNHRAVALERAKAATREQKVRFLKLARLTKTMKVATNELLAGIGRKRPAHFELC